MRSTLIGHISTGSQVTEQSSGAGAGRADTDPCQSQREGDRLCHSTPKTRQKHSFGHSVVRERQPREAQDSARVPRVLRGEGGSGQTLPSPGSERANVHRVSCRGNILLP